MLRFRGDSRKDSRQPPDAAKVALTGRPGGKKETRREPKRRRDQVAASLRLESGSRPYEGVASQEPPR